METCRTWEDYEHSSAGFYEKNKLDAVPVDYEELS